MLRAIVSLSGGLDSTTALALALERYNPENLLTVGFRYGSKHNLWENEAASSIAEYYSVPFQLIDLREAFKGFQSNLLLDQGEIPEGHYQEETMRQTIVPGRNLVFLSILAGLAASKNCQEVWIGIHAGDHHIYDDCRPEFFGYMSKAIYEGVRLIQMPEVGVGLFAPFLHDTKAQLLRKGLSLPNPAAYRSMGQSGIPYYLTRTCYADQAIACGKCGSCQERLSAFNECGVTDPLAYQTRVILPKKG